jgi:hypothetical protein
MPESSVPETQKFHHFYKLLFLLLVFTRLCAIGFYLLAAPSGERNRQTYIARNSLLEHTPPRKFELGSEEQIVEHRSVLICVRFETPNSVREQHPS